MSLQASEKNQTEKIMARYFPELKNLTPQIQGTNDSCTYFEGKLRLVSNNETVLVEVNGDHHFHSMHRSGHYDRLFGKLLLLLSHQVMPHSLRPHGLYPTRLFCLWDFPGENTGVGYPFPSPGDIPDPGSESIASCIGSQVLYHCATRAEAPLGNVRV